MRDVSFAADRAEGGGGNRGCAGALIDLLMRFYEIDGGRITLDGVEHEPYGPR